MFPPGGYPVLVGSASGGMLQQSRRVASPVIDPASKVVDYAAATSTEPSFNKPRENYTTLNRAGKLPPR
jgi:hypothetical protein